MYPFILIEGKLSEVNKKARCLTVAGILCILLSCLTVNVLALTSFTLASEDIDLFETILQDKDCKVELDPETEEIDMFQGVYEPIFEKDDGTSRYMLNKSALSTLSKKDQKALLKKFIKSVETSDLTGDSKRRVYNALRSDVDKALVVALPVVMDDMTPDVSKGLLYFSAFHSPVSTALGVGILVLLCVFVFRVLIDLIILSSSSIAGYGIEYTERKGRRPVFMSSVVYSVLEETYRDEKYKNAFLLYAKEQGKIFIIMLLCISYLLSGKIADLVLTLIA